jgi:hypothetical protein
VDDRGFNGARQAELRGDGSVGAPQRLLRGEPEPSRVRSMRLSPDGRLLAHQEQLSTGDFGLFVTQFPSGEGRWQVQGAAPRALPITWSPGSDELFFVAPGSDPDTFLLMAVPVKAGAGVTFGSPVALFSIDAASVARGFDVSPDGRSLALVREDGADAGQGARRTRYTLIENWFEEFAGRAP